MNLKLKVDPVGDEAAQTFVLVHGAWHGGWCYRDTARLLRFSGHRVYTPTLTGVGERAHLNNQNITLETHIRDICGVLEAEELHEVILLGHSYGGMVITGVADRMGERIKALVYLDAFVPDHAQSTHDCLEMALAPADAAYFISAFRTSALEGNNGLMQPIPADGFGVRSQNSAWVNRRCTPQALATFETAVLLRGNASSVRNRVYILAEGWHPSPFKFYADLFSGKEGWIVRTVPCGHDVMVDMPEELASLLMTEVIGIDSGNGIRSGANAVI